MSNEWKDIPTELLDLNSRVRKALDAAERRDFLQWLYFAWKHDYTDWKQWEIVENFCHVLVFAIFFRQCINT